MAVPSNRNNPYDIGSFRLSCASRHSRHVVRTFSGRHGSRADRRTSSAIATRTTSAMQPNSTAARSSAAALMPHGEYLVIWARDGDYAYYDSKILPRATGARDSRSAARSCRGRATSQAARDCLLRRPARGHFPARAPGTGNARRRGPANRSFLLQLWLPRHHEATGGRATGIWHRWVSHRHARSGIWTALWLLVRALSQKVLRRNICGPCQRGSLGMMTGIGCKNFATAPANNLKSNSPPTFVPSIRAPPWISTTMGIHRFPGKSANARSNTPAMATLSPARPACGVSAR